MSKVEWGEYRLGELFEIHHGRRLTKADRVIGETPFLTAGQENQGVACFIGNDWEKYTNPITVDMFGNCFFHNGIYSGDDNIYFFTSDKISNSAKLFIANCIAKETYEKYSYGKQFRQSNADNLTASLPTKNGKIDFDFMEAFIAELEAQRIAELSAYLKVSGYDNYELSAQELKALEKIKAITWGEYRIGELFTSSNGDYDIQKTHINGMGDYVITSGVTNNGILGKSDIPAKIFDKGTITIDMFGYAFYRQFQYKTVTHARVFSLKPFTPITDNQGLFFSASFNYLSSEFGYENMCSWGKIKNKTLRLPKTNGKIDFDFMNDFISAIIKLAIKDVVIYADRKIKATKDVIENSAK